MYSSIGTATHRPALGQTLPFPANGGYADLLLTEGECVAVDSVVENDAKRLSPLVYVPINRNVSQESIPMSDFPHQPPQQAGTTASLPNAGAAPHAEVPPGLPPATSPTHSARPRPCRPTTAARPGDGCWCGGVLDALAERTMQCQTAPDTSLASNSRGAVGHPRWQTRGPRAGDAPAGPACCGTPPPGQRRRGPLEPSSR